VDCQKPLQSATMLHDVNSYRGANETTRRYALHTLPLQQNMEFLRHQTMEILMYANHSLSPIPKVMVTSKLCKQYPILLVCAYMLVLQDEKPPMVFCGYMIAISN
jgi:hypothetical protein